MTWKQIKDAVESQEVTDETEVNYVSIDKEDNIIMVGTDHTGAVNILST